VVVAAELVLVLVADVPVAAAAVGVAELVAAVVAAPVVLAPVVVVVAAVVWLAAKAATPNSADAPATTEATAKRTREVKDPSGGFMSRACARMLSGPCRRSRHAL